MFYVSLTCIIGYCPFIVSLRFMYGNCNLLLQTKALTYKNNRNYKNKLIIPILFLNIRVISFYLLLYILLPVS